MLSKPVPFAVVASAGGDLHCSASSGCVLMDGVWRSPSLMPRLLLACRSRVRLSSQTKDTVNYEVMLKLRAHGLTVENILSTSEDDLRVLISKVG